jgi:transposase
MEDITTIGLDIAKHVFQVHGVDAAGNVAIKRRLRRGEVLTFFAKLQPTLIGIEACATSHYWARELSVMGHNVKLMPPHYVKPYVKRQKNDMTDAAAICEAVTRPSMRFVPLKSEEQQAVLMLHRSRELLVRQHTMLVNALRAHLAEFGIVMKQGKAGAAEVASLVQDAENSALSSSVREALLPLVEQLRHTEERVTRLEQSIVDWHKSNPTSQRLASIPGIGPITASAIVATITDARLFSSGRHLAAWLGLVPRQNSSGGKERLGGITKKGDGYIRKLLVIGANAVLRFARKGGASSTMWASSLLTRKPHKVVAVALANKMARISWALLARNEAFRAKGA